MSCTVLRPIDSGKRMRADAPMNDPTPRRTREETRQLVLDAAVDLVRKDGLGAEPTTITYQKVFDHLQQTTGIRVTRASVHERIWENQEDFQFEVLLNVSRSESSAPAGMALGLEILEATEHLAPMERARELTRAVVPHMFATNEEDPRFYSWIGMTMSLARDATLTQDRHDQLAATTAQAYEYFESSVEDLLRTMANSVGLRPRASATPEDLDPYRFIARMGLVLIEGANVRTRFGPEALPDVSLPGCDDSSELWSPLAFAYWSIVQSVMEIDPEVHPDLADEA